MRHSYIVALGSNMRIARIGPPPRVIDAALVALELADAEVVEVSPIISSRPVGPSQRLYANAAALVKSDEEPLDFLASLQSIEGDFGRRRRGARWRSRPIDLDIVLWSGGVWHSADLIIPHPLFRERDFVAAPTAAIAPDWRDPISGLTMRQIAARVP